MTTLSPWGLKVMNAPFSAFHWKGSACPASISAQSLTSPMPIPTSLEPPTRGTMFSSRWGCVAAGAGSACAVAADQDATAASIVTRREDRFTPVTPLRAQGVSPAAWVQVLTRRRPGAAGTGRYRFAIRVVPYS